MDFITVANLHRRKAKNFLPKTKTTRYIIITQEPHKTMICWFMKTKKIHNAFMVYLQVKMNAILFLTSATGEKVKMVMASGILIIKAMTKNLNTSSKKQAIIYTVL